MIYDTNVDTVRDQATLEFDPFFEMAKIPQESDEDYQARTTPRQQRLSATEKQAVSMDENLHQERIVTQMTSVM